MERIFLYSVDTASFYTDKENVLFKKMMDMKKLIKNYKKIEDICSKIVDESTSDKKKAKFIVQLESVIGNKSKVGKINTYIDQMKKDNVEDLDKKVTRQLARINEYAHYREIANSYLSVNDGAYKIVDDKAISNKIKEVNEDYEKVKVELDKETEKVKGVRKLRKDAISENNKIAQFESFLTRTLGIEKNKTTEDVMIVRVYSYKVMEQLIKKGYTYKKKKYIYSMASAGQIRNKKIVMINEKVYQKHEATLLCGLSKEKVNKSVNDKGELKNININKWTAYKALINTSSTRWNKFMDDKLINNSIVVPDFEFDIKDAEIEYINKDYEVIEMRKTVTNPVMDGAGIMLPTVSKKNLQIRAPFLKGLLVSTDFTRYLDDEEEANPVVKDVWGNSWDIVKDDIQIIFTASQLKMWQYYDSWEDYKDNFIKHNCEFSIAIEEEEMTEEKLKNDSHMNYQFLQTLEKVKRADLLELAKNSIEEIEQITSSQESMLKVLGAVESNEHKKPLEQALMLYPQLLADDHVKNKLMEKKRSMVKEAKAGRIKIKGSKRSFLAPDVYAFMQWLFLGKDKVTGLLQDGEVSCKLFKDNIKADVLRSPHNYIEHAVRVNINPEDKRHKINQYFTTNAIYTSIHDLISKILVFDVDGDTALMCSDETLVRLAEEHTKGIVPLEYELGVGTKEQIESETEYEGLKAAFSANIGTLAMDISKIYNSDKPDMKMVKILCAMSNQEIDYAKTLFRIPLKNEELLKQLKAYKKSKLPYFFRYAKNKKPKQVEKRNSSTVNKLSKLIPSTKLKYPDIKGFDYEKLMSNKKVEIDKGIIEKFESLVKKNTKTILKQVEIQGNVNVKLAVYTHIKEEMLKLNSDIKYIVDVLIRHLYENEKPNKDTFWNVFGSQVLINLKKNLEQSVNVKSCLDCEVEFEFKSNRQSRCPECAIKRKKQKEAEGKKNKRTKKAS